jgi:phosphoribosyl 1,2-cyclic phosphodiesterase
MRVSVLASGSKGNSIFVEMDGMRFLVDAGISARQIQKGLATLAVDIASINGVFITHEHRDHIKGLVTLSRKYHLPIFTRSDTFRSMYCVQDIPQECFHDIGDFLRIGSVSVGAFNLSHDAADPVGYTIEGSQKFTVATDLGFVTSSVQAAMESSDVLVLEANHDPDMLKNGSYPWPLKRRIMSNRGHLSNSDAAWALVRLKEKPPKVFLAHLSEKNNRPLLARDTVRDILTEQGMQTGIELQLASQEEIVSL